MSRRTALALGIAAVVATGAGTAVRLLRSREDDDNEPAAVDLWSLTFDGIEGSPVSMAALRGKPLLLNFWATWCGPCVVEMPLLDRFARERGPAGWQVLALAIDQPDPVRRFVAERNLRLPVAVAGPVGLELSRQLGNRNGGLPFTATFDSSGAKVVQHLGPVDAKRLSEWAGAVR